MPKRNKLGRFTRSARKNPKRHVRARRANPIRRRRRNAGSADIVAATVAAERRARKRASRKARVVGSKPRRKAVRKAFAGVAKPRKVARKPRKAASKPRKKSHKGRKMPKSVKAKLSTLKKLDAKIKRLKGGLKRGKKPHKRTLRRRASVARLRALQVQSGVMHSKRKNKRTKKYMHAHKLSVINPSFGGMVKGLKEVAVGMPAFLGSMAVVSWTSSKLTDMLMDVKFIQQDAPQAVRDWLPVVSAGMLTAVAVSAARMSPKTAKWALPIFYGGMAVTAVQALFVGRTSDAKPWGSAIGLPLGEYVGVSGFVTDATGQRLAVDGFVEAGGQSVAFDGLAEYVGVSGMGDYVGRDQYSLQGAGIFEGSTLGQLPAPQQSSEGRSPFRGTSEEQSIMVDFADSGGGVLSGSIFD